MKIKDYIPYILIISILLGDIIIYSGLIKLFFGVDSTIIAGVISFIGAILGGAITYLGVKRSLKHRDREVFLSSATEKLMIVDGLLNTYKVYLNTAFLLENSNLDLKIYSDKILSLTKDMINKLNADNEKIYRCMEYDSITILSFHKKSLNSLSVNTTLTPEQTDKCIEKIREIFRVINVDKEQLEKNYYRQIKDGLT